MISQLHAQPKLGTRAMGMGGAFRAVADDADAILYNPAGMVRSRVYTIGGLAGFGGENEGREWSVSVKDTTMSRIGAGFGYAGKKVKGGDGNRSLSTMALAISYPLTHAIGVGVNTKYMIEKNDKDSHEVTGDLGLWYGPLHWISLGVVGYNIYPADIKPEGRRHFGMGVAFTYPGKVLLSMDCLAQEIEQLKGSMIRELHYGLQLTFKKFIDIRGGFVDYRDDKGGDLYTLGFGWRGPRIHIDYAFCHALEKGVPGFHYFSLFVFI